MSQQTIDLLVGGGLVLVGTVVTNLFNLVQGIFKTQAEERVTRRDAMYRYALEDWKQGISSLKFSGKGGQIMPFAIWLIYHDKLTQILLKNLSDEEIMSEFKKANFLMEKLMTETKQQNV